MTEHYHEQVRHQLAEAQAELDSLRNGLRLAEALLAKAQDERETYRAAWHSAKDRAGKQRERAEAAEADLVIAEQHIEQGNEETLKAYSQLRAAIAERDSFAAGVPLICCDERHEAKVSGLETRLTGVEAQWAQDVRSLDRVRSEWRKRDDQLKAALRTDEHHIVMWGGLPFCSCRLSLAGGDATGTWIAHRLTAVREMLDAVDCDADVSP